MAQSKVATGAVPGEKPCTKCGETKPITEFYSNGSGRKGLKAICKACEREQRRLRYAADPTKDLTQARQYHEEHKEEKNAYNRLWYLVTKEVRRGINLTDDANSRARARAKKAGVVLRDCQHLGPEWETLVLWHYWFGDFADTFAISRGDKYPKATTKRERRNLRAELSRMDHSNIGYTGPDNFRVEPRFLNERRFSRTDGTVHPTTVQIMLQGVAPCGEPLHPSDLTDEMCAQVEAHMKPIREKAKIEWDAVLAEKKRTGSWPRDAKAWLTAYRENAEALAA